MSEGSFLQKAHFTVTPRRGRVRTSTMTINFYFTHMNCDASGFITDYFRTSNKLYVNWSFSKFYDSMNQFGEKYLPQGNLIYDANSIFESVGSKLRLKIEF